MKKRVNYVKVNICLLILICIIFLIDKKDTYAVENQIVCQTEGEVVEYLKKGLIAREENIVICVDINAIRSYLQYYTLDNVAEIMYAEATSYLEESLSYEGDALRNNILKYSSSTNIEGNIVAFDYNVSYITTESQEKELVEKISKTIKDLDIEDKSDFKKARVIYDYICENIVWDAERAPFDDEYPIIRTAYSAMCNNLADDEGFAELFYRMCKEAGLSVRCITGGFYDYRTTWNIVRIGKEYYNVYASEDANQIKNGNEEYCFLKSDIDFVEGLLSRDWEYRTNVFYDKYPVAQESWFDYSKLSEIDERDNLDLSVYDNVDGSIVTNQSNEKPKLLVFGKLSCGYTQGTIKNLSNADFSDIDVIFVEDNYATKDEVMTFRNIYGSKDDGIIYTYNEFDTNLWDYVNYLDGNVSGITYPYIVYINTENKIVQHKNGGVFTAEEIRQNVDEYLKDNELISLSSYNILLKKGECADLEVAIRGRYRNSQFFIWECSDDSVVTVDENGGVVAKSFGEALITCKVNDEIYKTCKIIVSGSLNGLNRYVDGQWYYYSNGVVDKNYVGMAKNKYGWWYVTDGKIDQTYTGMAKNKYGWWYMKNGKLDLTYTGMARNKYGWWYMKNGKLDLTYTGMAKNKYGWWYMKNGKLDLTYTGMAKNKYGWWYMKNGKLDLTYTGMAKNKYGWWYMKNGKLDLTYIGMAKNKYGCWYMKNGKLDTSYTGVIDVVDFEYLYWCELYLGIEEELYYINNGKLDTTYTGMAKNSYGWWYIKNGEVDVNYIGIAENAYGIWYMENGALMTMFTGEINIDGKRYKVKNGKVFY